MQVAEGRPLTNLKTVGVIWMISNISMPVKRSGELLHIFKISLPVTEPVTEKTEESYIYVIHAVDLRLHKIGYTNNVARRYKELRHQQIPSDLGLVASYKIENAGKVENYLHNLFADKERHSEWFSLSKKDLSLIDSTLKRMGGIREPN